MGKPGQDQAVSLPFHESTSPQPVDAEHRTLLSRRISELALELAETPLAEFVDRLYRELAGKGLSFRPKCYLADEWGCPSNVPVIGIPFYLATPELTRIESELTGLAVEEADEIMMFLRHEAGHAFNYAYRLYEDAEWTRLFGPYSRPYHDEYRADPFSDQFVRHIPGWYAQKHPDEDFAETFAVWLTPGSNWPDVYGETRAIDKLRYVERTMKRCAKLRPVVLDEDLDAPMAEIQSTLAEWYGVGRAKQRPELPKVINYDLRTLFPAREGAPAAERLRPERGHLIRQVYYWTGVEPRLLGPLVDELLERIQSMGLRVGPAREAHAVTDFAVMIATLAMNYEYTGSFVKK